MEIILFLLFISFLVFCIVLIFSEVEAFKEIRSLIIRSLFKNYHVKQDLPVSTATVSKNAHNSTTYQSKFDLQFDPIAYSSYTGIFREKLWNQTELRVVPPTSVASPDSPFTKNTMIQSRKKVLESQVKQNENTEEQDNYQDWDEKTSSENHPHFSAKDLGKNNKLSYIAAAPSKLKQKESAKADKTEETPAKPGLQLGIGGISKPGPTLPGAGPTLGKGPALPGAGPTLSKGPALPVAAPTLGKGPTLPVAAPTLGKGPTLPAMNNPLGSGPKANPPAPFAPKPTLATSSIGKPIASFAKPAAT